MAFLAIMILLSVLQPVCTQVYYVIPDTLTPCPPDGFQCNTLNFYTEALVWYFEHNSVIRVLPGTHVLNKAGFVRTGSTSNLTITGFYDHMHSDKIPSQRSSIIQCNNQFSLGFKNIENLFITNLSFIHCGWQLPLHKDFLPFTFQTTLAFWIITNLLISGVVIRNSTGFGITAYNLLGHPRILNSVFINNTGGEDYVGGNLLMVFNPNCSDVQSNTSYNAISFTIQSSHILHGYTPQVNTRHSTGLDIRVYDSCLGFKVKVDNVTFSQNGRKNNSATVGGNLQIDVVHRENSTAVHHIYN